MIRRRAFLGSLGIAAAATRRTIPGGSATAPRKVVIGTVVQPFWVEHPGLDKRLDQLAAIVGRMAADSKSRYGRGLDLAILPEVAITGEADKDALACSVPYAGAVANVFARAAREHRCYIIVPTYLRESPKKCSNAALLVDREGRLAGTYRKVHLVVANDGKTMEAGSTPGTQYPVFDCDFGKLGIQICYDMEFDRGWEELARKGAEIIAWPTQSPQTSQPAARAMAQRCYIVSSTWRNNASVFEPTGKIPAQIRESGQVLAHEIDLSYSILPWTSKLRNGKALREKFGDKVGYRYYEDEDCGIFWSNDASMPVKKMVESLGLLEAEEQLAEVRESYRKAGMADY